MEEENRTCNGCRHYEPETGVCTLRDEEKHGFDEACEKWRDWEGAW